MKKIILSSLFIILSVTVYGQAVETEKPTISINDNVVSSFHSNQNKAHSKISKVAFYEALISEHNFEIILNDSDRMVIKNVEQIISKKRRQILYTELDQ